MNSYTIKRRYPTTPEKRTIKIEGKYSIQDYRDGTSSGESLDGFSAVLSTDIDVFKDLPTSILKNKKIRYFLTVLRKKLNSTNIQESTLSKLHVSENNEENTTIEWIFNFFRAYFSFEADGNDTYGFLEIGSEGKFFRNTMDALDIERYPVIVSLIVDEIIKTGKYQ